MKKSLLSILAVVAMAFGVVACGNGKLVDAQVKLYESMALKLDSIESMDQFHEMSNDMAKVADEWAKKATDGLKLSAEETQKITDAATAFSTKAAAKVSALAQKEAEAAAAKAAEEAAAAEAAAKEVKK